VATAERPRVLLVDDNEMVLEYSVAMLSPWCVIVGALRDGKALLDWIGALQPDVVVLDISMPGMTGLEVALRLRRAGSTVPIVFLTVHYEEEFVEAAHEAGAFGYVLKRRLQSDLLTAIAEARAGRQFVSPVAALRRPETPKPVGSYKQD
jgi:DNA-binding NarL/FixJ family response regulator